MVKKHGDESNWNFHLEIELIMYDLRSAAAQGWSIVDRPVRESHRGRRSPARSLGYRPADVNVEDADHAPSQATAQAQLCHRAKSLHSGAAHRLAKENVNQVQPAEEFEVFADKRKSPAITRFHRNSKFSGANQRE